MATNRRVKESLRKAAQKAQGAPDEMLQGRAVEQKGSRARGLGRSLSDILAETEDTPARSGGSLRYEPGRQMMGGLGSLIPSGGGETERDGRRELDADFGPYQVDLADQYFQGPTRSTRVAAHQFVPLNPDWEQESGLDANTMRGHIYVRFQRKTGDTSGTQPGDLWRYGECSLTDYRSFRETFSKGRAVRTLEAYGHGRATDSVRVQI